MKRLSLADTSVWIRHFRTPDLRLTEALQENRLVVHPFVLAELALGNIPQRTEVLRDLKRLPRAEVATEDDFFYLIEKRNLRDCGIGFVDVHLIASAILGDLDFWTWDKPLAKVWGRVGD